MDEYISLRALPSQNTTGWVAETTDIFFLTMLDVGKSRIKMSAGVVSSEASLLSPWLIDGHVLPGSSHNLPSVCVSPDRSY